MMKHIRIVLAFFICSKFGLGLAMKLDMVPELKVLSLSFDFHNLS
jgi:hypothetical protein